MKVELNYLNNLFETIENGIALDIDCGYTGEEIASQLKEKNIIENIISILEKNQEYNKNISFKDLVNVAQDGEDTEYIYKKTIYYAHEIVNVLKNELSIND